MVRVVRLLLAPRTPTLPPLPRGDAGERQATCACPNGAVGVDVPGDLARPASPAPPRAWVGPCRPTPPAARLPGTAPGAWHGGPRPRRWDLPILGNLGGSPPAPRRVGVAPHQAFAAESTRVRQASPCRSSRPRAAPRPEAGNPPGRGPATSPRGNIGGLIPAIDRGTAWPGPKSGHAGPAAG
jgi:hypothetical protein